MREITVHGENFDVIRGAFGSLAHGHFDPDEPWGIIDSSVPEEGDIHPRRALLGECYYGSRGMVTYHTPGGVEIRIWTTDPVVESVVIKFGRDSGQLAGEILAMLHPDVGVEVPDWGWKGTAGEAARAHEARVEWARATASRMGGTSQGETVTLGAGRLFLPKKSLPREERPTPIGPKPAPAVVE